MKEYNKVGDLYPYSQTTPTKYLHGSSTCEVAAALRQDAVGIQCPTALSILLSSTRSPSDPKTNHLKISNQKGF